MVEERDSFIGHLERLRNMEDRGALAALRKGLDKPPGTVPEMFEHIIPYVPRSATMVQEDAYFLIASLFASYPDSSGKGNMGETFIRIFRSTGSESIEGRFVALMKCHREELPDHLRHAVALARSMEAAIDWEQLLNDVLHWDDEFRGVQRRWARSYWENMNEDLGKVSVQEDSEE